MSKKLLVKFGPVTALLLSPIVISVLAHSANAHQEQVKNTEQIRMLQDADNLTACTCPFCATSKEKN